MAASTPTTHDHSYGMQRIFTPEEANEALTDLRPVAEQMVAHRRALTEAQHRQAALVVTIAGNGGDLGPSDLQEAAAAIQRESDGIAVCVRVLDDAGVQVKSLEEGLLDFPSLRDGEDILLCWQVGEPEVAFWHGIDEGFAGRKPLDD
jgi:hypothetical protein